jgi:acyl carrier protein
MHLLAPLETGKAYRAHVRMQPDGQSGAMVGDVYVLDGTGSAVTVIKQMIFRPDPSNYKAIPNVGDASSTQRVLRMHNSQNTGPSVVPESQGSLDSSPCTLLPEKLISTPQSGAATTCAVTSRKISPKRDISRKPTRTPPVSSGLEELQTSRSPISDGKSRMRFESVIDILAAEIGVESEYLTDDILLKELGVDSIIELSVVARLQEYMSETLPPAFLMKHNSISKLREFFTGSALSAWFAGLIKRWKQGLLLF